MSSRRNVSVWIAAFKHAFSGLGNVIRTQQNAWVHALATIVVVAAGLWLQLEKWEWAVLLLAIAMVWLAECFNTALEFAVDLASPDVHPLARQAKDAAAAAVLVAAIFSLIIGLLIFVPLLTAKFAA
jgi:diacylglycerol kinase (ATP)